MEATPIQLGDRCNATELLPKGSLRISSILFDKWCTSQCKIGSGRDDLCNSNMAHPAIVSSIIRDVISQIIVTSKTKECSQRSFKKRTCITNQNCHDISGVENFRKSLALSGMSESASQLIAEAR